MCARAPFSPPQPGGPVGGGRSNGLSHRTVRLCCRHDQRWRQRGRGQRGRWSPPGCPSHIDPADRLERDLCDRSAEDGVFGVGRARDLSPAWQRTTALRGAQRQTSLLLLPCGADCRRRAAGATGPAPGPGPLPGAAAHTASARPWRRPLTQAREQGRPHAAVKAQSPGLPQDDFHQPHVSDPCM